MDYRSHNHGPAASVSAATAAAASSSLSPDPPSAPPPVLDTSGILSWSDEKVKSASQLRARQDLRRNKEVDVLQTIQKRLRTTPDIPYANIEAERQAQIYKAWIGDQEGSPLQVGIINANSSQPADGCPPYDFVWVNGYVHDDTIPPSNPDDLQGCDCDDDVCNPVSCKCFDKAIHFDTLGLYKEHKSFAYNADGTLHDHMVPTYPIFECNSKCACSSSCINRVVQKGRRVEIDFFKHEHYGWGIRARHRIKKHTFIGIYSGELMSDSESDRRGMIYESVGSTYHFELDMFPSKLETMRKRVASTPEGRNLSAAKLTERAMHYISLMELCQTHRDHETTKRMLKDIDEREIAQAKRNGRWTPQWQAELESKRLAWEEEYRDNPETYMKLSKSDQALAMELEMYYDSQREANELTVDGALHGNFTRFFNHSCDPNLAHWPVWIEEGSIWRPYLCFFAIRQIEPGDELTFSYTAADEKHELEKKAEQYSREQGGKPGTRTMKCLCGAANCRGYVFS